MLSFSTVKVPPGKVHFAEHRNWIKWEIPHDRTKELEVNLSHEREVMKDLLAEADPLQAIVDREKEVAALRKFTSLQKIMPAFELISYELANNAYKRCVVLAQAVDVIRGLQYRLHDKFGCVTLFNGTPEAKVQTNVRRFQGQKQRARVFITQISAANLFPLDLQANHVFMLEESLNPAINLKAIGRVNGNGKPVFVRSFCVDGTHDFHFQNVLRDRMVEMESGEDEFYRDLEPLPDIPEEFL